MIYAVILMCCMVQFVKPDLDTDNPSHRSFSNNLDKKFENSDARNKFARPVIHGTYHGARYLGGGNPEEWARAKDQYSKVGTGQAQTKYLKEHRAQNQKQ